MPLCHDDCAAAFSPAAFTHAAAISPCRLMLARSYYATLRYAAADTPPATDAAKYLQLIRFSRPLLPLRATPLLPLDALLRATRGATRVMPSRHTPPPHTPAAPPLRLLPRRYADYAATVYYYAATLFLLRHAIAAYVSILICRRRLRYAIACCRRAGRDGLLLMPPPLICCW